MKKIVLLFFLCSLLGFAQKPEDKSLKSPYNTVYTHLYYLQENSYDVEKAASTVFVDGTQDPEEIAIKIKRVLDGKGLRVNMTTLPKNANYLDTVSGLGNKPRYVLFPNQIPEIYLEKVNGNWYYSQETSNTIEGLYRQVYPLGTEYLKKIIPNKGHIKLLGIELWQYLGFIVLILLGIFVFYFLKTIIFWVLQRLEKYLVRFSHSSLNDSLLKLARPIALLWVFYLLEKYIPILQLHIDINSFILKGVHIAQIVLWIYVFLQFVQVVMDVYSAYSERTDSKLDDQLVPILNRLLKGIVVVVGCLKMLTIFGADVTTVIAGASIGGLAVALASQDTVRNLIGTIMIFLDQPFQIGDWIEGGGVEGTVEEVGFRSSRIRAADTSIFTIPNSKLSEIVINNKGLRLYRRYNTTLGIRYDTPPELIEIFVKGLRTIVDAHPDTRSDSYNVEFVGFGDSSLQILLNVYFKHPGWAVEQSSKHRLHMAIVKFANEVGVGFAFPSQTVMIEEFPEKKSLDMNYKVDDEKATAILDTILKDFPKPE
ncbi:mechanosensitive ion channel family protein [Flavicella sediminum]|uniref:mechanosensitive ion channel family protein n=1 Tax=Flavicella sediminum TaxID=2585141 RepID=UPI0011241FB8|nr:mechanosensitive ion channel family protein [Flavicella sediminum]